MGKSRIIKKVELSDEQAVLLQRVLVYCEDSLNKKSFNDLKQVLSSGHVELSMEYLFIVTEMLKSAVSHWTTLSASILWIKKLYGFSEGSFIDADDALFKDGAMLIKLHELFSKL